MSTSSVQAPELRQRLVKQIRETFPGVATTIASRPTMAAIWQPNLVLR